MELILASGSARRRELLKMCGYDFTVMPCNADERIAADTPAALVRALSLLKAKTVYDSLPAEKRGRTVVLGSDTVVVLEGRIIGKPKDERDAFEILKSESGRMNTVYTGLAVVGPNGKKVLSDRADVWFNELTDDEISAYIATGEPMDKAGAYGIQGSFSMFIKSIRGSYFTVVGLPLHKAYPALASFGVRPKGF